VNLLKNLSIRRKLVLVAMVSTGFAILTASGAILVNDRNAARQYMVQELGVLAEAVAKNSTSAVLFMDSLSAEETLEALRAESSVRAAAIYDPKGTPFATFQRDSGFDDDVSPKLMKMSGHDWHEGGLSVYHRIELDTELVGTLWLESDLSRLDARMASISGTMALVGISAGLIALLVASWLQRFVSRPVLELANVAQRVKSERDYTVRAQHTSNDELGSLVLAVNDMLGVIQERDAELERHREKLEEKVADRTAALTTLNEQLRLSMEEAQAAAVAKSQFLANMSHEIRTPMNGVMGMTNILLDTKLDDNQRETAQTVMDCAEGLLNIINDILDFSKIEAGKLDLEQVDFDLRTVLDRGTDLLFPQAHGKGLELACLVEPDVPTALRGDPGRTRQIVLNFLNNAVKFTHEGEVVVSAALEEETDHDALIRISVRDTGIGIPEDRLHRLFQVFSQVDASNTREFGGTGLGLAISKQLSEAMGGGVGVSSDVGGGSCFWFTARFEKQPKQPERVRPTPAHFRDLHVLVVDDNATNRTILEHNLTQWGCWPHSVASGPEALKALAEHAVTQEAFGLALIDMQMPGMDGEELAAKIRADRALRNIPVIMLTSMHTSRNARRFEELGIDGYLAKPVKPSKLFDCIALVLGEASFAEEQPGTSARVVTEESVEELKQGVTRTVLVVEDNLVNQKVATAMLRRAGYEFEVAATGAEGLEMASERDYDAILMDCQMPVMDGFEATRKLRAWEADKGRHTPIIAMTANAMKQDPERCREAGMDDYLSKPVKPELLAEALKRWCPRTGGEQAEARRGREPGDVDGDGLS
jgi:signal transduction histidine kinase/DNA-binding response OmpR family regulator